MSDQPREIDEVDRLFFGRDPQTGGDATDEQIREALADHEAKQGKGTVFACNP